MRGQKFMVRTIRSGAVVEQISFPVAENVKPRSARQRGNSRPRQQSANERACGRRFARLINCNFGPGDLLLQPSYDEQHIPQAEDVEQLRKLAERECDKFIRRLKDALKRQGVELRYIALTSDMDGDTGGLVRIHHHVLIPAKGITMRDGQLYVGERALEDIWGRGGVDYKPLSNHRDYTQLAGYLLRQVRRVPDKAKWKASRNLRKPQIVAERVTYSTRELHVPKGAKLLERAAYIPGEGQYIRYTAPEKARKVGGKRE